MRPRPSKMDGEHYYSRYFTSCHQNKFENYNSGICFDHFSTSAWIPFSERKYGPNWYKVCTFRSALEGEYLEFWKAVLIRMVDIKALFCA